MDKKSNKELAIEATIEYVKSWNASPRTNAVKPDEFISTLKSVYTAICSLDEE